MVGSNEAQRHREQEARPDQARGCWRWNIEEPTSGADDQAKNESDDCGSHNTALLRTRSNRNRNPICGADAGYANAIGGQLLPNVDSLPRLRLEPGTTPPTALPATLPHSPATSEGRAFALP